MNRTQFLDRVRDAAKAGRAFRIQVAKLPEQTGYVGAGEDRCASLAAEAEAVGGEACVLEDAEAARHQLNRLLELNNTQRALCWQHPLLERLGTDEILAEKSIQQDNYESLARLPSSEQRARILSAEVGISSVDYAVAETGSLVVCSRPGQERVISLLPPVHIAIVGESQIVPDLFDVFSRLDEAGLETLPSNLAFITGPSKTGDIELQLTTGVHGPGNWHLLILRGW